MNSNEVVIVGAGLAGLTAAIHLSKMGHSVIVVEKNTLPQHKVCGEYVSNEVLPYLRWLGIEPLSLGPAQISTINFSSSNSMVEAKLPLGGFGISRYTLDYHLYQKALDNGCRFIVQTVTDIAFDNDCFTVTLSDETVLTAKVVLGAFGKRSTLDQKMSRPFMKTKAPWLGVKAHYRGNVDSAVVGLHNFRGGYCGVSKVENDLINICYLADYESFKQHRNIESYEREVLGQNPHLKTIFENCEMIFEAPLTISQISFAKKLPVENHILMIGDTAGMIHPLCGNGMAMAIHSAKLVSELVLQFDNGKISRVQMEHEYTSQWNSNFKSRLAFGRFLSAILRRKRLSEVLIRIAIRFPILLKQIIRHTHGQPITAPL